MQCMFAEKSIYFITTQVAPDQAQENYCANAAEVREGFKNPSNGTFPLGGGGLLC